MNQNILPTSAAERIISLDVLRGLAILGIFIMNILGFSMIYATYFNPTALGELAGTELMAFYASHIIANQKFMTLFSMLFGAGIVLMSNRMEAKGLSATKRHYLRNFWLLLIGLFHAYILWHGDILVSYALCAMWLFLFRKKTAKALIIWGCFFLAIPIVINLLSINMPADQMSFMCQAFWSPNSNAIAAETNAFLGTWSEQMPYRVKYAMNFETSSFLFFTGWRVTGVMLIGMALFKLDILSAQRSKSFYTKLLLVGLGLGLAIEVIGLMQNTAHDWSCSYAFFIGSLFNYVASILMALGYIAIIMLICKSERLTFIKNWLAPAGQMAFTNYLMQSVIGTLLFYGHGFGLFGQVNRVELWGIVILVWIVQILLSKWWLQRFYFGPAEWLWRSLTYLKPQKFKRI